MKSLLLAALVALLCGCGESRCVESAHVLSESNDYVNCPGGTLRIVPVDSQRKVIAQCVCAERLSCP